MVPWNHKHSRDQQYLQPLTWKTQTLETWWNFWCRWWSFQPPSAGALCAYKKQADRRDRQKQSKPSHPGSSLVINRTREKSCPPHGTLEHVLSGRFPVGLQEDKEVLQGPLAVFNRTPGVNLTGPCVVQTHASFDTWRRMIKSLINST